MAQKRKTNHSKKPGRGAHPLHEAETILRQIEEKTARQVKNVLSDNWRDNLFEIMMTRVELAAPHKKKFSALPAAFRKEPQALAHFARLFWGTMKRMLSLAGAPARPPHIAAFGALYLSVIDTFIKDATRDHAKTMAVIDKRLAMFEQLSDLSPCK